MKNIIVLTATILFYINYSTGQNTAIPDPLFEAKLINYGYDAGELDGFVPTANIENITEINLQGIGISDLTGIEDFTALTDLNCAFNHLTNLDISNNTSLTILNCRSNELMNLDISQNLALTSLSIMYNNIASLDISEHTALEELYVGNTALTNLNLSNNLLLKRLNCSYAPLEGLDVSSNTALIYLSCGGSTSSITNLDLSQNIALEGLYCQSMASLYSLDLSNNPALTDLICSGSEVYDLDVTACTALTRLDCSSNWIGILDLSNNTALEELNCSGADLFCLNVKNGNNTILTQFNATYNAYLNCINVDDPEWSMENWTYVDNFAMFSSDCIDNNCIVSTNNIHKFPSLEVYPNPTRENISIHIGEKRNVEINLMNNLGQKIFTQNYKSTDFIKIDINAPKGIYFLEITSSLGERETIKLIKD